MKIRLNQLRSIIREEVEKSLSEMSLAAIVDDPVDMRDDKSDTQIYAGVKKFHKTDQFKAKAEAAFRTCPFPVYIVPVTESLPSDRVKIYGPDEGLKLLKKFGIKYDLEDLASKLKEGGVVFLNSSMTLRKSMWPTPWMMIHAFVDNDNGPFEAYSAKVIDILEDAMSPNENGKSMSQLDIVRRCTMASARNFPWRGKSRGGPDESVVHIMTDLVAELVTQEIATTNGVQFITDDSDEWRRRNPSSPPGPKTTEKVKKIQSAIKALDLKQKFFDMIRGKVILVQTGNTGV